jgi:hypothetical protein
MKWIGRLAAFAVCVTMGSCGTAHAGAPAPDERAGDFAHVCKGGSAKNQSCTVETQATDCPGSECIVLAVTRSTKGLLTLIAHDSVTDWANGGATNRALTVMLEVKAPDGTSQMLAATYQDLAVPTDPPTAPSGVIAIGMDEAALKTLSTAVSGLLFVQPESTLAQQLQTLFGTTGTPAIVAVTEGRSVELADHTGDGLATVLRFKIKLQFLEPAA